MWGGSADDAACTQSHPWRVRSTFGAAVAPHLDYIHQCVYAHVGCEICTPGLDGAFCERERGLVKAVEPCAPEHRAGLRHGIIYWKRKCGHFIRSAMHHTIMVQFRESWTAMPLGDIHILASCWARPHGQSIPHTVHLRRLKYGKRVNDRANSARAHRATPKGKSPIRACASS